MNPYGRIMVALLACGSPLAAQERALWQEPEGTPFRVTSAREGVRSPSDEIAVAAGAEITLLDAVGPGVVTRLWLTLESMDPDALRMVLLRAFFEDAQSPCVEVPLADLFALGPAAPRPVTTAMVEVTGDGRGFLCRWPMPYQRAARIQLRNDSAFPLRHLTWQIDGRTLPRPHPGPLRLFHAAYAQSDGPGDFRLVDIHGAGHYVGTVLSIAAAEDGWGGEGDQRFYLDGADQPALVGTGLDDDFGDAWTFHEHQGPDAGVTLHEGTGAGARSVAYRWHLADPIPFVQGLRVEFERSGWALRAGDWRLTDDRRDRLSGIALWYQEEPHARAPNPAAGVDRLPWTEYRLEPEALLDEIRVAAGAPAPVRQDGSFLAFGAQLVFAPPTAELGRLTVPFVLRDGKDYDLVLRTTAAPHAGVWRASLDGAPVGTPFDLFARQPRVREDFLGRHALAKGEHVLTLECVGRDPESTGYTLALDSLCLRW